jgi:thiol-disulfide isomerase/thioredoxin
VTSYRAVMRKRLLAGVTAAALLLTGCGHKTAGNQVSQAPAAGEIVKGVDRSHAGNALPALRIDSPQGKKASLPDPGGKPMLINLWATWCGPCIKELPTLQALSQRAGAPQVVEISEDMGSRASVDAFLKQHGIDKLKSWQDPKSTLTTTLDAQVLPTTIYYDGKGREVWRYIGDLDWTGPEAAKLLAETGQAG